MTAKVRVHIPEPIISPLADMEKLFAASLLSIVPERRDATIESLAGVTIELLNDPSWVAHYQKLPQQTIRLSIRTVETLWCIAYAYVILLDEVYAKRPSDDRSPVDLTTPPEVRNAMSLLHWAMQDWIDGAGSPIPTELMPPRLPRQLGSHASVADELCLCAVAFILHHELAHHRLKHLDDGKQAGPEDSIDMEKDADTEAVQWILGSIDPESRPFTKRAAGIVVALVGMTGHGVHTGKHGGRTHPRNFDRLIWAIERFGSDPNAPAWIFATMSLKLHLDNSATLAPTTEYGSFKECLHAYVDHISRHAESSPAAKG